MCQGNCKNCKCGEEKLEKESIFQPCPKCQSEVNLDEESLIIQTTFPARHGVVCNSCGWKGFLPTKREIESATKWLTNVGDKNGR